MIARLVSVFVCIIRFFNDVGHFLSLFMQLAFELFVKIVKDDSFLSQGVDDIFEIPVNGDSFIVLLIGLVKSIFEDFDLLLKIGLIFSTRVHTGAVFLFLDNFLLEVGDMNIDVVLDLFFLLNDCSDFGKELFHVFHGLVVLVRGFFIIDFSLRD